MGTRSNGQGSPPCSLELTQQTETLDSVGTREAGLGHIHNPFHAQKPLLSLVDVSYLYLKVSFIQQIFIEHLLGPSRDLVPIL